LSFGKRGEAGPTGREFMLATTPLAIAALVATLGLLPAARAVTTPADAPPRANSAHGATIGYTCYGCHGIPDYRNAYPSYHVPKIGGQREAYIVVALDDYRIGARPHPTMKGQAASLSEQDVRDLAAFFAGPEPVTSSGSARGPAPAAAQVCAACHGLDGVGVLPEYPTLAGQHRDYIEQALRAYRKGARQSALMNGFAATLTDADIGTLAGYFAGQPPRLWVPRPPHAPGAR
jgi:cytochrome c553